MLLLFRGPHPLDITSASWATFCMLVDILYKKYAGSFMSHVHFYWLSSHIVVNRKAFCCFRAAFCHSIGWILAGQTWMQFFFLVHWSACHVMPSRPTSAVPLGIRYCLSICLYYLECVKHGKVYLEYCSTIDSRPVSCHEPLIAYMLVCNRGRSFPVTARINS